MVSNLESVRMAIFLSRFARLWGRMSSPIRSFMDLPRRAAAIRTVLSLKPGLFSDKTGAGFRSPEIHIGAFFRKLTFQIRWNGVRFFPVEFVLVVLPAYRSFRESDQ